MLYLQRETEEKYMAGLSSKKVQRWEIDQLLEFVSKRRKENISFDEIYRELEDQNVVAGRTGRSYSKNTLRSYMSSLQRGGDRFKKQPVVDTKSENTLLMIENILGMQAKDSDKLALITQFIKSNKR